MSLGYFDLTQLTGWLRIRRDTKDMLTGDGYKAYCGEDSDQVPSRIVQRSVDWNSLLFRTDQDVVT
ncbi:hypothetical protein MTR_5g007470 [Medicago truncatula]|uniref:Uncharacterized protein n=1 Tax=Medicago truncatula TaxID=3880 RepID=G7K568_MEDTR|nr:hypothetical protein MTR_5g007470 [Medicago truncatula]